jgi:hypothetical protein
MYTVKGTVVWWSVAPEVLYSTLGAIFSEINKIVLSAVGDVPSRGICGDFFNLRVYRISLRR